MRCRHREREGVGDAPPPSREGVGVAPPPSRERKSLTVLGDELEGEEESTSVPRVIDMDHRFCNGHYVYTIYLCE